MAAQTNDVAIRKRTQIAQANRTMFIWIAIASALVGIAAVVGYFMAQKLFYNERVLGEKQNTVSILEANNKAIPALEDEIRALDTNSALATVKANDTDQAIQVILDALPSDVNSNAFGASLQNKLLNGIEGLTIESLQVDPVIGIEVLTGSDGSEIDASATDGEAAAENAITFQFTVVGSQENLKQALLNLEKSVRAIVITSARIEILSTGPQLSVQGKTFYEPEKTIGLTKKVVK